MLTDLDRETTTLRFAVGVRVGCRMEDGYQPGKVVAHFYREEIFPRGRYAAYQVRLDDAAVNPSRSAEAFHAARGMSVVNSLIYAIQDVDETIREHRRWWRGNEDEAEVAAQLECSRDINAMDELGNSLLCIAASVGNEQTVAVAINRAQCSTCSANLVKPR